ncbi:MAG: hypothetical protein M3512_16310 [Bacteroidota bacterium]|nr:hypothetical protein [Bacteroidota bacterium]
MLKVVFNFSAVNSTPFLISFLGLLFAIFQVFLNINIQKQRDLNLLRQAEYKEVNKILNPVVSYLYEFIVKGDTNFNGLIHSIQSTKNEFDNFLNNYDDYFFEGIKKKENVGEIYIEFEGILNRLKVIRRDVYNCPKDENGNNIADELSYMINYWHTETLIIL